MLHRIRSLLPSSLQGSADHVAFLSLAGCISLVQVSIAASQILLAVVLVLSPRVYRSGKDALLPLKGVLLPLLLYCLWTVTAALMAPDALTSLAITKKFYLFLLIPVVPLMANLPDRVPWIYKTVFPVAVLSAVIGILQYASNPQKWDLMHRISGSMGHWMTYSGLIMLALVALAAHGMRAGWKKLPLWIAPAALMALAIVLSQTRSSLLGVYAGIFAALVLAMCIERHWRFAALLASMVLVSFVLYFAAPASLQQRFRSGLDRKDDNTRNRIELYETSLNIIRSNPWFGVGPENVKYEALKYRNDHTFRDALYLHMHNNVLEVAAETGIPGALFWLWFMLRLAWDSFRFYRTAASGRCVIAEPARGAAVLAASVSLGAWFAFMVSGMFEYNFGDSEVLTLFLFLASAPYAFARPLAGLVPSSGGEHGFNKRGRGE